ncbi:MAG TPA: VOC family protein [Anaerolineales bacterium]|nr:VOC family protein [Anaerolineales bacterium]
MSLQAELDHLVVAADTLEQGAAFIERVLGVRPQPGGQHKTMGTHNLVLRLGERQYLEVIAVDPDLPDPDRPRWFGLDGGNLQQRLRARPRLIHWVARTPDLEHAVGVAPLGAILPMSRGEYHWRITVPEDGTLPGEGLVPTLIQWDAAAHPAERLPDRGCRLRALHAVHPLPDNIRQALTTLGLTEALTVIAGPVPSLRAEIETPDGIHFLGD